MGKGAERASAMPAPGKVAARPSWEHLSDPFYDKRPNDKGIGIQLGYSLARVSAGFCWPRWWRCRSAS
jgi:nitrate/nitrite transport system permease protein